MLVRAAWEAMFRFEGLTIRKKTPSKSWFLRFNGLRGPVYKGLRLFMLTNAKHSHTDKIKQETLCQRLGSDISNRGCPILRNLWSSWEVLHNKPCVNPLPCAHTTTYARSCCPCRCVSRKLQDCSLIFSLGLYRARALSCKN